MRTCETCYHWLQPHDSQGVGVLPAGWGRCEKAESGMDVPIQPATLAWATDYDHYGASLNTAPDFGCVMYEAEEVREDDGA